MDNAVISLLGDFLLSILGLFVFVWSLRKGLLKENPYDASVIFARGEVGQVDDPALPHGAQKSMQQAVKKGGIETDIADPAELQDRIASDQSTAFPVFMFISFACLWLVVGSLGQPLQRLGMFVGGVVVQHHMNLQIWCYVGIDLLEKFQPLHVPVARLAMGDDGAVQNVERRKWRGRFIAFVVVGMVSCASAPK